MAVVGLDSAKGDRDVGDEEPKGADSSAGRPPLVSFALFAYNQEAFIADAVHAALAQDYSPLQVILSDDCSADATFSIMACLVENYRGPHQIVLNRNATNLGVAGHINRIMELAKGELIVEAAGDDISMPCRVSKMVSAWQCSDRRATSIYSSVELIDENGDRIGYDRGYRSESHPSLIHLANLQAGPRGAAHSFSRQLFSRFGPLNLDVVNEDQAIAFRTALVGSFAYVPQPLVKYRVHSSSLDSSNHLLASRTPDQVRSIGRTHAERLLALLRQCMQDALQMLATDHPVIETLRIKSAESVFAAVALDRTPESTSRMLGEAISAVQNGASRSVIAKYLIKRWTWPVYARYSDWRRRLTLRKARRRSAEA